MSIAERQTRHVTTHAAGGAVRPPGRPTARQVEAVYAVMRLLRRDPIADSPDGPFTCDGCGRDRQRGGSVAYGSLTLCNGCATDYELVRLADSARRAKKG